MVCMMLDATKSEHQRRLLETELEAVGIRLNKKPPNIYFKKKKAGGLTVNAMCRMTKCTEKLVQSICAEYSRFCDTSDHDQGWVIAENKLNNCS